MSQETGLSPASVMRIWHAFGIKPHLEKTFKLSTDPLFVDKVHDISSPESFGLRWPRVLRTGSSFLPHALQGIENSNLTTSQGAQAVNT